MVSFCLRGWEQLNFLIAYHKEERRIQISAKRKNNFLFPILPTGGSRKNIEKRGEETKMGKIKLRKRERQKLGKIKLRKSKWVGKQKWEGSQKYGKRAEKDVARKSYLAHQQCCK